MRANICRTPRKMNGCAAGLVSNRPFLIPRFDSSRIEGRAIYLGDRSENYSVDSSRVYERVDDSSLIAESANGVF